MVPGQLFIFYKHFKILIRFILQEVKRPIQLFQVKYFRDEQIRDEIC